MSLTDRIGPQSNGRLPARLGWFFRAKRFWNWKTIVLEAGLCAIGFELFNKRAPSLIGLGGFFIGIFTLWLLVRELYGVAVDPHHISMPTVRISWLPIIAWGRRSVSVEGVRECTVAPRWLGFEVLQIKGAFGGDVLVFPTRGQRRRFTNLIEKLNPNVVIYRQMPPPTRFV